MSTLRYARNSRRSGRGRPVRLTIALTISRRVYVIDHGRVVFEGTPHALCGSNVFREEWLEV